MRAGTLRHLVTVQEPAETKGTLGDVEQTWSNKVTVWAAIEPVRGDERFALMQEKVTADIKVTMRAGEVPDLTPRMRLVHESQIYDIEAIVDVANRGITFEVFCKAAA
jgi:SPP1 family predicted phage head-tail adaptor